MDPLWIPSADLLAVGVKVSCSWKDDQGRGNRKGRMAIALLRCISQDRQSIGDYIASISAKKARNPASAAADRQSVLSSMAIVKGSEVDLFGITEHECRSVSKHLDASHEEFRCKILERQRPGDGLVLMYGGTGTPFPWGHSLTTSNNLTFVVFHTEEANREFRAAAGLI